MKKLTEKLTELFTEAGLEYEKAVYRQSRYFNKAGYSNSIPKPVSSVEELVKDDEEETKYRETLEQVLVKITEIKYLLKPYKNEKSI